MLDREPQTGTPEGRALLVVEPLVDNLLLEAGAASSELYSKEQRTGGISFESAASSYGHMAIGRESAANGEAAAYFIIEAGAYGPSYILLEWRTADRGCPQVSRWYGGYFSRFDPDAFQLMQVWPRLKYVFSDPTGADAAPPQLFADALTFNDVVEVPSPTAEKVCRETVDAIMRLAVDESAQAALPGNGETAKTVRAKTAAALYDRISVLISEQIVPGQLACMRKHLLDS